MVHFKWMNDLRFLLVQFLQPSGPLRELILFNKLSPTLVCTHFCTRILPAVAVLFMLRCPSCASPSCRLGILQPAICSPLQGVTFTQHSQSPHFLICSFPNGLMLVRGLAQLFYALAVNCENMRKKGDQLWGEKNNLSLLFITLDMWPYCMSRKYNRLDSTYGEEIYDSLSSKCMLHAVPVNFLLNEQSTRLLDTIPSSYLQGKQKCLQCLLPGKSYSLCVVFFFLLASFLCYHLLLRWNITSYRGITKNILNKCHLPSHINISLLKNILVDTVLK